MTWRICIDTGGTFTDAVAMDPQGQLTTAKILSNSTLRGVVLKCSDPQTLQIQATWLNTQSSDDLPGNFFANSIFRLGTDTEPYKIIQYDSTSQSLSLDRPIQSGSESSTFELQFDEEAPVLAARLITATSPHQPLPPMQLRLATTRGTNALLEQKGAPTVLFVTTGFADLLQIGNQQRPDLFTLNINKQNPLTNHIIEIPERIAADGTIVHPLPADNLFNLLHENLQAADIHPTDSQYSAAIALLNSHTNPIHEQTLHRALQKLGFNTLTTSHEVAPFIRYLQRTQTTVVDAYLAPIIQTYLKRIAKHLDSSSRIFVMTSAGGLQSAATYRAKDSLLSGPAGGVAGAASAAKLCGMNKIIAFDMGGTSTDVSRYDQVFEYEFEHQVGAAQLMAPALSIHTVAAGGGSICSCQNGRLQIGPESASAHPGPACYGRGGPLTVTDINLLLNRIIPERFGIPINRAAAQNALTELQEQINTHQPENPISKTQLLQGCLDIANERMADAVRKISIRRGFEPTDYTLTAFGGAGGQHACALADRLNITSIIIPPNASLLSAQGLASAAIERIAEKQLLQTTDQLTDEQFSETIHELQVRAQTQVANEGTPAAEITISRIILEARFLGQDATIEIDLDPRPESAHSLNQITTKFIAAYQEIFNHAPQDHLIQFVNLRVIAASITKVSQPIDQTTPQTLNAKDRQLIDNNAKLCTLTYPTFERADLQSNQLIQGPALILEDHCVTVIEPSWQAGILDNDTLLLEKITAPIPPSTNIINSQTNAAHAVQLELFTNRFCALTEEMGEMLRRTALSTNVKERLDFSCALLDADAELVVNAPHIPVHLGAIGACVRHIRTQLHIQPGDVLITNHPAYGGSHLPDITLITPVFLPSSACNDQPKLLGYVANRAHHAEIGGTRPGSMPPDAKTLAEEGVVIQPTHLIKRNIPQWDALKQILTTSALHPTRAVNENIEDLRAAVAANHRGHQALLTLADQQTPEQITHYMQALKSQAENHTRTALKDLPQQKYQAIEYLDDQTPIQIKIDIDQSTGSAAFDFTGSGPTHPGNLNATPAIVRSAVMYVLRLLINEPIPLNEGMMQPIEIRLPENSFLNPNFSSDPQACPAVVGGNVETSQRIVDTLLKAFDLAACSQGTMNNILFGNENFGYYETVAGGSGATTNSPGASAVHTHMTNTGITDPEIIEHRYPVRINRFAIRKNSGGAGDHPGGDGIIREYEFTQDHLRLSVLTQHRTTSPYAQHDANPGKPGTQYIIRKDSNDQTRLSPIDQATLNQGDRLILKTPGGGGSNPPRPIPNPAAK